jgi:hypothetical protein
VSESEGRDSVFVFVFVFNHFSVVVVIVAVAVFTQINYLRHLLLFAIPEFTQRFPSFTPVMVVELLSCLVTVVELL